MKLFQNDISFITKDIKINDIGNLRKIIRDLMEEHLKYSIATPFFYIWELDDLKDQLPNNWKINIDQTRYIPKDKVRITITNAYFDVSRHFNPTLEEVILTGQSIGKIDIKGNGEQEDVIAIDCEVYDNEKEKYLFELDYARGESPIRVSITGGELFQKHSASFNIPSGYGIEDLPLEELGDIEKISQFVNYLFNKYV